jgi:glycosyltransferase involved in cell wall biosynthesis
MKIAFIGQKGMPTKNGGVDRHVENLAVFLAKKGNDITVYNRRGYLPEEIKEWQGVKLVHLPFVNNKNLAAITHGFLATISAISKKVDVIHYHGIGPALLTWIPRLFAPKIKIITTLHSFDYGNDKWGGFAKFMLKWGESNMCKYSHEVIVLTNLMHDYLLQRYGRESQVIPNGAYIQKNNNTNQLMAFGLEPQKYIISVCRLIRLKGLQYAIEAFNKLNYPEIKLVIVGDGEYRDELEKIAGDNPHIIFSGNQAGEALDELYSNALMFIQSSEMEGLSISFLEAMAHGLPCLASDILANKEASQETAVYFKSKDVGDLQDKLKQLLDNKDKLVELGKKAQIRAEENFNWDKLSDQTLAVYSSTPSQIKK